MIICCCKTSLVHRSALSDSPALSQCCFPLACSLTRLHVVRTPACLAPLAPHLGSALSAARACSASLHPNLRGVLSKPWSESHCPSPWALARVPCSASGISADPCPSRDHPPPAAAAGCAKLRSPAALPPLALRTLASHALHCRAGAHALHPPLSHAVNAAFSLYLSSTKPDWPGARHDAYLRGSGRGIVNTTRLAGLVGQGLAGGNWRAGSGSRACTSARGGQRC